MPESIEKPIFVVGCPRSGTTILAAILNAHPEITTATETHFFNYISKEKKYNWKEFDQRQFDLFLDESRIVDFYTLSKITKEELQESFKLTQLGANPRQNKKLVFNILIQALLKKKNKKYFCEKTPQHLLNVEEILEIYPSAKFIHLIRDGRDAVNSLIKMPWRPDSIINNSRFWGSYIRLGQKFNNKIDKNSFLTIKYEELLKNPKDNFKKICDFIGVEYLDSMITREGQAKDSSNIFSDWESSWKHKSLEEIDSTRIGAWQKELAPEDQSILNWHQKKILQSLGYSVTETKPDFKTQVKIALEYTQLFSRKILRLLSFAIN